MTMEFSIVPHGISLDILEEKLSEFLSNWDNDEKHDVYLFVGLGTFQELIKLKNVIKVDIAEEDAHRTGCYYYVYRPIFKSSLEKLVSDKCRIFIREELPYGMIELR